MILWLTLFLLVIGISFILAFRSMRDYQEIPQTANLDYGLFLIRQTGNFNPDILGAIRELMVTEAVIVSIERVFKGRQTALTIFGPKSILDKFQGALNLLELEDYTANLADRDISIWEVGEREAGAFNQDNINYPFSDLPQLDSEEQFFWQVVLGRNKTQIRAAVYSQDPARRKILLQLLQNLNVGGLIKIPKPFSSAQMLQFYRTRSLSKDSKGPLLSSEEVIRLMKV